MSSTGFVGINKPAPVQALDVVGNGVFSGSVGVGTITPATDLELRADFHGIRQTSSNGLVSVETYVDSGAGWLGTFTNHPLWFFTNNGAAAMALTETGNLGIGTTTPTHAKVDIQGFAGSVSYPFSGVGILDNLGNSLPTVGLADSKMWWQAKYHHIQSKFDQGKYEVAAQYLRDVERKTAPPLGAAGGLTEEFKVLKDDIAKKTFGK